ncbi:unnamed protein product [Lupinus luteus]|uniref:glucan endo-1,3-beta-D-glucosidase n=1 Tax=Lupinus luteus TaxID=3873 RepID=A0AAV1Y0B9_LUPLU
MAKAHLVGKSSLMAPIVLQFVLLIASISTTGAQIGVVYGTQGNNLPPPKDVVNLLKEQKIQRVRIYEPNKQFLEALQGSNIEVVLGIPNKDLINLGGTQAGANKWVEDNIKTYTNVKFRYIVVGNEVKYTDPNAQFILPAIQNIGEAISKANLGTEIKVTTAIGSDVLGKEFPPSAGEFRSDYLKAYLSEVIKFLTRNNTPILASVDPYRRLIGGPATYIHLDFALFERNTLGPVRDGSLIYTNLFDVLLDATHSALEKAGGGYMRIVISATGWPSSGIPPAILDNAKIYNTNLVKHVEEGTPQRHNRPIETYVYALFDENEKPTNTSNPLSKDSERFWGLFLPNKQPKYPISLN